MRSLEQALAWAKAGWPVFPCRPNKRPWFADWQEVATTKPETIRKWWEHDTGDYRVGVVPAMADPPCFVLDVDVKGDKHGEESLKALASEYGFDPSSFPTQDTPSGGRHLFMRGVYPTSAGTLGEGLDTRGGLPDGTSRGYILAYAKEPPCAPATLREGPGFRAGLRPARSSAAEDRTTPVVEYDAGINIDRAKKYLATIVPAEEGERNAALFRHICSLKDLGVSLDTAFALVEEYPAVLGDPMMEDVDEIQATIRSAYDNGQAQPGQHAIDPETIARLVAEETAKMETAPAPERRGNSRPRLVFWPDLERAEPPQWIVKGLIPDNALVGVFGPGGSYKSFLTLDLALAVATGQAEWGGREVRKPGPVVIVQGEGRLDNRALAWQQNHVPIGDRMAMIPGIDLSDADDVRDVALQIKQAADEVWFAPPRLIIIDTLGRASGAADENSSKDMGRIVQHCDALRTSFGCTVILVHHTPKGGESWRGSTAVYFALDTALAIKGKNLKGSMVVTRQKDGEVGCEWAFKLCEAETGRTVDDEPEKSLLVQAHAEVEVGAEEKKQRKQAAREVTEAGLAFVRTCAMQDILMALPAGSTMNARALASALAATLQTADAATMGAWLRAKAKDGTLGDYVRSTEPLEFGVAQEKTPDLSTEGLPV